MILNTPMFLRGVLSGALSRVLMTAGLLAAIAPLAGCSFYARSPEDYRDAVAGVLAKRSDEIERCFAKIAKDDKNAEGKVQISFYAEPKTGAFKDLKVNSKASTAPEAVQECVVASLKGLKLDPPDQRKGEAKFSYNFTVKGLSAAKD